MKKWGKTALLRTSILAGFAAATMFASPAFAQQQTSNEEEESSDRDVVLVTGSRILRADYTSGSPLHTVTGEELEEIGAGTLETYLNSLPQLSPSLTRTNNNPVGGGAAFLDMRQLGTSRNLVLLDGRRIVPGAASGAVNVSILPSLLIDRTEVVTGGASAVYGADAISGVVNFITRQDFDGTMISSQYGVSGEGDGTEYQIDFLNGGDFDDGRGRLMFGLSYNNREGINQADREISAAATTCNLNGCFLNGSTTTGDGTFTLNAAQASNATLRNYFTSRGVPLDAIFSGQRVGFNTNGSMFIAGSTNQVNPNDRVWLYTSGYQAEGNYDPNRALLYNFNPENLLQSPFERYSFFTNLDYDINDHVELYGSALYATYDALNQLASSPAGFTVSLTGPAATSFINPDARAALVAATTSGSIGLSRRTVEFGPRIFDNTTDAWQLTGGVRGDFDVRGNNWRWDFNTSYGSYHNSEEQRGYPHLVRINAALNGCPAGSPLGPVGPSGAPTACVPFNPFGYGNITQPQINYIEAKAQVRETNIVMQTAQASITGDAFDIWAGPVAFAAGVEYRSLDYSNIPGEAQQTGALLGANSAGPVNGSFDVAEAFGELRIPLLAEMPFVEYLGIEAGYRYSDYANSAGNSFATDTWKLGAEWEPTDYLRFRVQAQQAVRAPSVGELFTTRATGFPSVGTTVDPCNFNSAQRTGANATQVRALCAAQSAAIANDPNWRSAGAQFRTVSGGNPNLDPETATTYTYGFVLSAPEFFPNAMQSLTLTVDYWDIEIENVISSVGFATSLSRCYDPVYNPNFTVNNAFCQNLFRDPATGYLTNTGIDGYISQTNANLATLIASGVDVGASMSLDFIPEQLGAFSVGTVLTWYENQQFQSLPGNPFGNNVSGTIGNGTPGATTLPEWKATTRLAWTQGPVSASLRWVFLDEVVDRGATVANRAIPGIDAYNYFYGNVSFDVNETVQVFGGIDNLLDEEAPVYTNGFAYNTDPSTYDVIGRFFYAGARLRF
ncbi:MAG: TonB-dependent receptor [Maricaulis sp.]|jgi:outer membrane receptor protein involved in Fe transport|nr:TonB-dependent receptor [Maricaulis sp.]